MRTKFKYRASKNGLYGFLPFLFLTLIFLILILFILNCFAEQLLFNRTLAERQKSETSLEKSKRLHAKCRKSGKMGKAKKKFDEVKKNIAGQVLTYNSRIFID